MLECNIFAICAKRDVLPPKMINSQLGGAPLQKIETLTLNCYKKLNRLGNKPHHDFKTVSYYKKSKTQLGKYVKRDCKIRLIEKKLAFIYFSLCVMCALKFVPISR